MHSSPPSRSLLRGSGAGGISATSSVTTTSSPAASNNHHASGHSTPPTNVSPRPTAVSSASAARHSSPTMESVISLPPLPLLGNLTVLALGDSLTNGFVLPASPDDADQLGRKHPYSTRLKELLGQGASVTTLAANGLTISAISAAYFSKAAETNIVVILGGTNDLYRGYDSPRIIEEITELHSRVKARLRAAGMRPAVTVAVTIPELPNADAIIEKRRRAVNEAIREYARASSSSSSSSGNGTTWVYDMDSHWPGSSSYVHAPGKNQYYFHKSAEAGAAAPATSSNAISKRDMWGPDMVHFSAHGYDAMGAGIFECIRNNYAKMRASGSS